ncbi:unnamed protein product [Urochloa decumbens]|uniref:Uncharacterized protein n=1 Tax=Urochloa decumbens TaxID=240449 RepID=A0ABC9D617_9POAL
MPVPIGLLYLNTRRTLLEKYDLLAVGSSHGALFDLKEFPYRTGDGKYNDPHSAEAGSQYTYFGRNMKPVDQEDELMRPDPFVVATKLLARREYKDTGKQFNILAAAWIQFMVHDWMDHMEDTKLLDWMLFDLESAPKEVANVCPLKSFKFHATKALPTNSDGIKIGYYNVRTAWWDGSAIYGNNEKKAVKLRTYVDGKLVIGDDSLHLHEENGVPLSGDVRNSWVGVSILQALFIKEHNAVCDAIKEEHPNLSDEELYRYAKLVTSAVIAKVHTIDWTVELLKTKTLRAAMRINCIDIGELVGIKGEEQLSKIGFEKQTLSMGYQACGALELWNYPSFFRDLIPENLDGTNRSDRIDLAALEVYRDRERSVPRYNEFRRRLFLIPIKSWEDLTSDKDAIEAIREIYGDDVEKLDLLVGLMAEKKIKGFAISETAFNIFILMASRRLEADRFFTSNFNEKTYTKKGMQWVKTTEGLRDVINRHYPEITAKWMKSSSAFSMWDADY